MKTNYLWLGLLGLWVSACSSGPDQAARWETHVANTSITRDSYGVAHVHGSTDADAVFGMIFAQCEDDFNRVEMNYVNAMGRLAEIEGESALYRDLRMKLYIDPEEMKGLYEQSPAWLQKLMTAWADGINYYLKTHPETTPKLINEWEPWMALTFSEGSIGGDIERGISISRLKEMYAPKNETTAWMPLYGPLYGDPLDDFLEEPRGSNGIAIAPNLTVNGNPLFLINPHTSFFFRSELHMSSDEGLNAYGATTWGQFFIYQGFNEFCGWMHTSTYADVLDEYAETVIRKEGGVYYLHGDEEKLMEKREIMVPYKKEDGTMSSHTFTTLYTHHGPVVRKEGDKYITMALMERPIDALRQSFGRNKANTWDEFYEAMDIRTNSSNNTVYADAEGNIAYFHGNYLMKRDDQFDWSKPVDGSNPATDYQGLHTQEEMIIVKNPSTGWIQNCNSTPFTVSGSASPKASDYPKYMAPDQENYRGIHAVQLLEGKDGWNLDKLVDAAYDPYMPGFAHMIPGLVEAFDAVASATQKQQMGGAIDLFRDWDYTWSLESVQTAMATYYVQEMRRQIREMDLTYNGSVYDAIAEETFFAMRLDAFGVALKTLEADFGQWDTPWGEINRYQRINGDIVQPFNDAEPSIGVPFASGRYGSLAAFGAKTYPGTKRMYGTRGNSFVAFVEFGDRVIARSISTGGGCGDPASKHFDDQAQMYADGDFKDVLFYAEDIAADAKRVYHPGE